MLLAVTIGHTPVAAVEESADRLRAANAALLGLSLDGAAERRHVAYEATYAYAGETTDEAESAAHGDAAADQPGAPAAEEPAAGTATDAEADGTTDAGTDADTDTDAAPSRKGRAPVAVETP